MFMRTDFSNFGRKFPQHRFQKFLINHYSTSVSGKKLSDKTYFNLLSSVLLLFKLLSDNIFVPFASKYDSKAVESGKYDKWVTKGYFHPKYGSNNDVFSIILPPPNITGTLHLGHALTVTIQDILCRW